MLKFVNAYGEVTKKDHKRSIGEKNDCVVRAYMNATGSSYDAAHEMVESLFNRKKGRGTISTSFTAIKNDGFVFNGFASKYKGSYPQAINARWNSEIKAYDMSSISFQHYGFRCLTKPKYPKQGYTVAKLALAFPKGRFIVIVKGHALAIVDGVIYDNPSMERNIIRKGEDRRKALHVFEMVKA